LQQQCVRLVLLTYVSHISIEITAIEMQQVPLALGKYIVDKHMSLLTV